MLTWKKNSLMQRMFTYNCWKDLISRQSSATKYSYDSLTKYSYDSLTKYSYDCDETPLRSESNQGTFKRTVAK